MVPAGMGPFEIISTIGAGPRGVVYRARHENHGRIVAVKQLASAVDPGSLEFGRLWNEIARLRAVVSNHVASTYSVELIDGRPVIEMESLGESLEKVLGSRSPGVRDALRVVEDILSGLKVMHDAGIVHGNLKASNVLQDTTTGAWKISDGGTTAIESQTAPTLLAASVLYVAPESVGHHAETTERSDLYSAGMIGLEAALGSEGLRDAFPHVTNVASPSRWLAWLEDPHQSAVPLHELRPEVPEPVSRFLARLLSKDPEARFPSAFAALVELQAVAPLLSATRTEIIPRPAHAQVESPATSSAGASALHLCITGPSGFEQRVELTDRTCRIGREAQNDIVLPDETKAISRTHAELRREAGQYVLIDLDSQNGLWLSGRRKARVQLGPGVTVKIGAYSLALAGTAAPAQDTPQPFASVPARTSRADTAAERGPGHDAARSWWPPSRRVQWVSLASAAAVLVAAAAWFMFRAPVATDRGPVMVVEAPTPTAEPTGSSAERLSAREKSLGLARELMGRQEYENALKEIDLMLGVDPQDADALALRKEAVAGLPASPPAVAQAPARPRPDRPTPPVTSGYKGQAARRAGESEADWIARDRRLTGIYDRALAALNAGELKTALAAWLELESQDATYPNLVAHLGATRGRLRMAVQASMQEGQALERSGDLPRALRALARARDLDPASSEVQGAYGALEARMRDEGTRAFKEAEQAENYKLIAEARAQYQKAFDYLPDSDPLKKVARARLDRIGKSVE